MRQRLGADVADGCHVGVCGGNERIGQAHVGGLGVDVVDDGLDLVFRGLFTEEGKDFFAFLGEGDI